MKSKFISAILMLTGSIFFLGYIEGSYSQQTEMVPDNNSTFARSVECFVAPCDAGTLKPSTSNQNTTALIGVAFNGLPLSDLQENKETLKSSIMTYVNSTIDKLANGEMTLSYTFALPIPECTPKKCIAGIGIPDRSP